MQSLAIFYGFLIAVLADGYNNEILDEENNSVAKKLHWVPGELCDRKCDRHSKTCYFEFHVENYVILSPACRNCVNGTESDCLLPQCVVADGVVKPILTVNRALPGTPIVVCKKDQIVVDVINKMEDSSITIHWHGIRQRGTPYMDGVAMVGQCPILPFTTFRYNFNAEDAGTFFWHSHTGPQKLDGLQGAIVIRQEENTYSSLYDEDLTDHVIFIQDWIHQVSNHWTPGPHYRNTGQVPDSVLINGMGPLSYQQTNYFVPMAKFTVESGKRYRFRLISATCMTCSFAIKIESHRLLVITGDGGLKYVPIPVDTIGVNSAERFDFILNANQTPSDYYIYVENLEPACNDIRQVGVLHYAKSNSQLKLPAPSTGNLGIILNDPTSPCDSSMPHKICVDKITGVTNAPSVRGSNARYMQIPFKWGAYLYDREDLFAPHSYQHYEEPVFSRLVRYTVNNISYLSPPSPFTTQFRDIPPDAYCAPECRSRNIQKSCSCTNYLTIPLKTIVDIIVYNGNSRREGFNHAFHLHGFNFYVLKMGVFPNKTMDARERANVLEDLWRQAENDQVDIQCIPQKDTITTPSGGYVLIRFFADNPGFWLAHCHFVYHLGTGMALVFQVGALREIPEPPRNFPRCGNYFGD